MAAVLIPLPTVTEMLSPVREALSVADADSATDSTSDPAPETEVETAPKTVAEPVADVKPVAAKVVVKVNAKTVAKPKAKSESEAVSKPTEQPIRNPFHVFVTDQYVEEENGKEVKKFRITRKAKKEANSKSNSDKPATTFEGLYVELNKNGSPELRNILSTLHSHGYKEIKGYSGMKKPDMLALVTKYLHFDS